MSEQPTSVLVVEDEPDLADLYAEWLREDYAVETANGGREALERIDEGTDVVLLDRRMPDLSGDEVLDAIRERGIDCRVAMVTAVEPDFDIVEMGFDDYLVKPVSREELYETVESLVLRSDYDEGIQTLFSLASKKALLESEKGTSELEDHDEYGELTRRIAELRDELEATMETLGEREGDAGLFQDLNRPR